MMLPNHRFKKINHEMCRDPLPQGISGTCLSSLIKRELTLASNTGILCSHEKGSSRLLESVIAE